MTLLKKMTRGRRFLKAGFYGFGGAGKTYTAVELACGVYRELQCSGPVVCFDTETGLSSHTERIHERTGVEPLGTSSRSFEDLMTVTREMVDAGGQVLIVDSITHVWRHLCDAMLAAINEEIVRKARKYGSRPRKRTALEFQDWQPVKARWSEWVEWFLNSQVHVIVCGRAGFEWDFEMNEQSGRKELVKTGIKMKAEGEMTYEPSLSVFMERQTGIDDDNRPTLGRRALVVKDRENLLDGQCWTNPTWKHFLPLLQRLRDSDHVTVADGEPSVFDGRQGPDDWAYEKRRREVLAEEIKGLLLEQWPSQSADDKRSKVAAMAAHWNTRSWRALETTMSSDELRRGLESLKVQLGQTVPPQPEDAIAAGEIVPLEDEEEPAWMMEGANASGEV